MNSRKSLNRSSDVDEQVQEMNEKIQLNLMDYFTRYWFTIARVVGAARFVGH